MRFFLVPTKEDSNAFLSSSLQQSSPTENPPKDDHSIIIQETIDQTISTIVLEEESQSIHVTDVIEEQKPIVSSTPSSSLNPDTTPFSDPIEDGIKKEEVISTGAESDDEIDSNDTPISSGSSQNSIEFALYFIFLKIHRNIHVFQSKKKLL